MDISPQIPPKAPIKWYYNSWTIVIAILCVGPLGLFLLWFRPRTNIFIKLLISVIVIAASIWMAKGTLEVYEKLMEQYRELVSIQK